MSFGERFKKARERKKISQQQLAVLLGVTDGTISNYEKGNAFPRWDTVKNICEFLDVDPNYLFWDDISERIRNKIIEENNLRKYSSFSPAGTKKVDDYINDLLKIPKYRKNDDTYEMVAYDVDEAPPEEWRAPNIETTADD